MSPGGPIDHVADASSLPESAPPSSRLILVTAQWPAGRLHDIICDVFADPTPHVLTDADRKPIVESGPDTRIGYFIGISANVCPLMRDAWCCWAGHGDFRNFGRAKRQLDSCRYCLADDAGAQGYSGCMGVLSIGCQIASRSVAALSSISPFRIAVTGRQKL